MASVLAYDAGWNVVASLDLVRVAGPDGSPTLLDPIAFEDAGGRFLEIWHVPSAIGSGAWPEHLGPASGRYRVELDGSRIVALVGRDGEERRDRTAIEAAVAAAIAEGRDPREVLGSPANPLSP